MAEELKTAADVQRLQHALKQERMLHAGTRRTLERLEADLLPRIEAIEARATEPVSMAGITTGLASIRADLRAELAAMRQELTDLADELHQFTRQP
jgi:hypothetical protein